MLKTQREEYYQPRECDVICGRGKTFAGHPGNKVFLRLVRSSLNDYANASGRFDRTLIVSHIAANFREYGVRFARVGGEQPGTKSSKKRSLAELIKTYRFYEIDDERKIHEKIGHAFRDMIRAQSSRSTTPAESNEGPNACSDSESVPSEAPSEPPKKNVSSRKRSTKSEQTQSKPKRESRADSRVSKKSQKEALLSGEKKQMALTKKSHGNQDNLALAFFEVESHVHKIHDDKTHEESSGDDKEDPFVPDVSILFNDSDSLAGLSFNSNEEPVESHNDGSSSTLEDSHSSNNVPDKIVVHWSKERQCSDKKKMSDMPRERSLMKSLDSKYDADAVRWSASSNQMMNIDPRRLLQEPLINDWHITNAAQYCAEFNPTNFDMNATRRSSKHARHLTYDKQHDDDDDEEEEEEEHEEDEGKCELDV